MKKRKPPEFKKHLWEVTVLHRDYLLTVNNLDKELHMTVTDLLLVAKQPPDASPSIQYAMSVARRFLNRHQRQYGMFTIKAIHHKGFIDN